MQYFEQQITPLLPSAAPRIVDIGCGQGEFVRMLIDSGFTAVGYDPVLRKETPYLHRRYWSPAEPAADLYVMRCVLPHIPDPWRFLEGIADSSPGALVLVEFQLVDWALRHSLWYQITHDHVNLFRPVDFKERYRVLGEGSFAGGEWAWVLIDPKARMQGGVVDVRYHKYFATLKAQRETSLARLQQLDKPLAIWGASGKGSVLADALSGHEAGLFAVDADPLRWGKYLEHSAVRVLSPEDACRKLPGYAIVLVANPNHLPDVTRYVDGRLAVSMPSQFCA